MIRHDSPAIHLTVDDMVFSSQKPNLWGRVAVVENNGMNAWVAWSDPLFCRSYIGFFLPTSVLLLPICCHSILCLEPCIITRNGGRFVIMKINYQNKWVSTQVANNLRKFSNRYYTGSQRHPIPICLSISDTSFPDRGLKFIGVVKTATSKYPMRHLSEVELQQRGDVRGLFSVDDDGKLDKNAFLWMDRDRRYFISNTSSLKEGTPYTWTRLRQVDTTTLNAAPESVEFSIPQSMTSEHYYSACGKIDQSNRVRQDDFQLERKLGTLDFGIRVNHSILGINDVDTYYLGKEMDWWDDANPDSFYYHLAEEMIDNTVDSRPTRCGRPVGRAARQHQPTTTPDSIDSFGHCTPSQLKRKKRKRYQQFTTKKMQNLEEKIGLQMQYLW